MKYFFSLCLLFTLQARDLNISLGESLPPWISKDTDDGIVLNILKECLSTTGHKVVSHYFPYARRIIEYNAGRMDIASDVNMNTIKAYSMIGHYSGSVYAYENYAYTLKKKNFSFTKIDDLKDYSILSWQGAIETLGGDYAKMAKKNKKYSETHNQQLQVQMLFLGRVDVIQMDKEIYDFYHRALSKEPASNMKQETQKFPLFGKNRMGFIFRDKKIQEECSKNLKKMMSNNYVYKNILLNAQD